MKDDAYSKRDKIGGRGLYMIYLSKTVKYSLVKYLTN